jgi:uncharacterized membrane protein YidH (DUF202 family)
LPKIKKISCFRKVKINSAILNYIIIKNGAKMNNKIIGIVLIIAGAALAMWGYNIYDAASSQVSRALSGDTPIEAWAGMLGGAICIVIGITRLK